MTANDSPERYSVGTTKRMVRDKRIQSAIVFWRKILGTFNLQSHTQVTHTLLQPVGSLLVTALPEVAVHLILMDDALEPLYEEAWYESGLVAHLVVKYFV